MWDRVHGLTHDPQVQADILPDQPLHLPPASHRHFATARAVPFRSTLALPSAATSITKDHLNGTRRGWV